MTTSKNWTAAQVHCRETYDDLATIGSHSDSQRLLHMTEASGVKSNIWIGLKETGSATWLWSVGETETSDGLVEYTNWANSPSSSHHCGGMRDDGKWIDRLCNTELPFVCQNGKFRAGLMCIEYTLNRSWISKLSLICQFVH